MVKFATNIGRRAIVPKTKISIYSIIISTDIIYLWELRCRRSNLISRTLNQQSG